MSEDPNHPWGTGATRYRWKPSVDAIVRVIEARWRRVKCNTYVCHPWCGWSNVSIDCWGEGGRGDPLPLETGQEIRAFLMKLPGKPLIRHTILQHQLWTSWGGYSYWSPDDHSGRLRHLHVTYWPASA